MSRTFKDKNPLYRAHESHRTRKNVEPRLKRRYHDFKQNGPQYDGETCPECGRLTEFQNGYLTCSDCGWIDDMMETLMFMERVAA